MRVSWFITRYNDTLFPPTGKSVSGPHFQGRDPHCVTLRIECISIDSVQMRDLIGIPIGSKYLYSNERLL
jgi:hypothetical protein